MLIKYLIEQQIDLNSIILSCSYFKNLTHLCVELSAKENNYLLLLDQILWFKIKKYQKEQSFINEIVSHWYFLNKWNKWNGKFLEDCVTDLEWETNNTYCKLIKDENDYSEYSVNFWSKLESLLDQINWDILIIMMMKMMKNVDLMMVNDDI